MNPMQRLTSRYPKKRILITGATAGLGEALTLQFAAAGFKVAVASRNPDKVASTVEAVNRAGGEGLPITLDVTRLEDLQRLLAERVTPLDLERFCGPGEWKCEFYLMGLCQQGYERQRKRFGIELEKGAES